MTVPRFGILHPGAMGVAVAITARNSGWEVWWASEGRRAPSRERAQAAGLCDARTVARLCETCSTIASVCPPEFAEAVADSVLQHGFRGTFLDANAVAPQRKRTLASRMEAAGVRFVDGGIIGFPPARRGQTWLCLSGPAAHELAGSLAGGPMEMEVTGPEIGQASALKMCFAAWTKGSTALCVALLAAAERFGVMDDLKRQWERRGPDYAWVEREILRAAPKAWRFAPEMQEIAATLESAGLPGEFHRAAAEIYRRLRGFKDRGDASLAEVLRAGRGSAGA
jgi:3-hydroxyisobutyrate dehydrogenase-like beta-hydroxyacid dehydrogenase